MMRALAFLITCLICHSVGAQNSVYNDLFETNTLSVGDNPKGYTMSLNSDAFRIAGNGDAAPWTAMAYLFHNGNGAAITVNAPHAPKLYIKARGENRARLRIDLQDESGFVTNLTPVEVDLDDDYRIYELDYTGKLMDGAFGGPCVNGPCLVDASALIALIIFVNAPDGGYNGNVDIDWLSIGAPLEDTGMGGSDMPTFDIRYNQVAYAVNQSKLISIVADADFEAIDYAIYPDGQDEPIIEGQTGQAGFWNPSREYVATIDISELNTEGSYKLEIPNQEVTFHIDSKGYEALSEASLKYFYFNRASQELTSQYAGAWARPMGHPDDRVLIHESAASANRSTGSIISAPKGWYDAGDYNKYVVNSGISTYTLLAAYEHYPAYYNSLQLSIPEQGGSLPDILDEVLWNLEWILSMQDPDDGGVYHKLTGLNFSGIIMPHEYNFDRYVVQKTTAAALNLAAVTATAARIFESFENVKPGFSAQLLEASKAAYAWAKANPNIYYQQPGDVSTGAYGDGNVTDEFAWAAAELYISTQEETYLADIDEPSIGNGIPGWQYTAPLALISLSHFSDQLGDKINSTSITNKLIATADQLKSSVEESAMRVAMGPGNGDFVWGSNGQAGNQIMILIRSFEITQDESYLDAAYVGMDYILGRNGTGVCYVSGFGDNPMRRPHHRASQADDVVDPVPGMISGGPNPGQQDGCPGYINNYPASSYVDDWCSFASNEVTINWNAPLAYSINALTFYQNRQTTTSTIFQNPNYKSLIVSPNPGHGIITLSQIENLDSGRLEVLNISGQVIHTIENLSTSSVDLSSISSGVYYLRYHTPEEIYITKWMKL